MRVRTLRGNWVDVERTASSLSYAGKPAALIQGIVVTERVQAEAEAAEYHRRLELLARELVATEERERRQLAHALHDHVGQQLAVARMRLQAVEQENGFAGQDFEIAMEMLQGAIAQTRSLTTELAPAILYELGVNEALRWLCGEIHRVHGLDCSVRGFMHDQQLDDEQRGLLFRSVRELLMNVVKHASATRAVLEVAEAPELVSVTVVDDGTGFDPAQIAPSSFGLMSIEQSLASIGGSLSIDSTRDTGTKATLTIPCVTE
jgi:signal transduction histidine kinase